MSREEQRYWANRAAYGPQSWWPILEAWGMKFGPWLNSNPWKCGVAR